MYRKTCKIAYIYTYIKVCVCLHAMTSLVQIYTSELFYVVRSFRIQNNLADILADLARMNVNIKHKSQF